MRLQLSVFIGTILLSAACNKAASKSDDKVAPQTDTGSDTDTDSGSDTGTTEEENTATKLNLSGAVGLVRQKTVGGNLALAGSNTNLLRINSDASVAPALENAPAAVEKVLVGPSEEIFIVFRNPNAVEQQNGGSQSGGSQSESSVGGSDGGSEQSVGDEEQKSGLHLADESFSVLASVNKTSGELTYIDRELTGILSYVPASHPFGQFDEAGNTYFIGKKAAATKLIKVADGVSSDLFDLSSLSGVPSDYLIADQNTAYVVIDASTTGGFQSLYRINFDEGKAHKIILPGVYLQGLVFKLADDGRLFIGVNETLQVFDPKTAAVSALDLSSVCSDKCKTAALYRYADKILMPSGDGVAQIYPAVETYDDADDVVAVSGDQLVLRKGTQMILRIDGAGTREVLSNLPASDNVSISPSGKKILSFVTPHEPGVKDVTTLHVYDVESNTSVSQPAASDLETDIQAL